MDEEKKSEESEEGAERVGPYLLQEQVEQGDDSQEELYLATNEMSGATALVRKHAAEESKAPRRDWRVYLGSWASRGYSAMEVEHTDWARAQDRQTAESLLLTLEGVLEEARRMVRAVSGPHESSLRWRLGWGVASAVTVCALLLALVCLAPVSHPPSAHPAPLSHEVPTAVETPDFDAWLSDTTPEGQTVLARPLPKEPFKGQKRPPCTRYTEVELVGACWAPHKLKAPCPETLFEYQGECYLPSFSARPPPSSLGQ
ncbi:hypothetical protein ATI61_109334 [Archangium gephyra]|uniref:Uncharacterized protein n=1 Tax=Archangium gephyra TaxID=48 RepID=A0AAC8TB17_9BACT|nr:hypothetical protein [Archangium gephyra]AKI99461.1 Hypothetical protein AA314_01088 [Archangium gephyra]REG27992.1 hypothetical protein ATI61_109334 [Archangium gephyra]